MPPAARQNIIIPSSANLRTGGLSVAIVVSYQGRFSTCSFANGLNAGVLYLDTMLDSVPCHATYKLPSHRAFTKCAILEV